HYSADHLDLHSFPTRTLFRSTFGGNPLACAVSMAAIDVLLDENLIERSAELGQTLLNHLQLIDSPIIDYVRGRGLFIGIELTEQDRKSTRLNSSHVSISYAVF